MSPEWVQIFFMHLSGVSWLVTQWYHTKLKTTDIIDQKYITVTCIPALENSRQEMGCIIPFLFLFAKKGEGEKSSDRSLILS